MSGTITAVPSGINNPGLVAHARQQAKELEGVFMNTLMKEMFSSIKTSSDAFGGGFAEETWRGMQAEQMADAIAQSGGIGLADAIVSDLLSVQQAGQTNSTSTGVQR